MAKSNLSLADRQIQVNANVQANSDFNGVDTFEEGTLVDFTATDSPKKDADGNPTTDSEGKPVLWTAITYSQSYEHPTEVDEQGKPKVITKLVPAWVGSDRILITEKNVGAKIQIKYTVFEAAKEYKAGKIKVGDTTQVVRRVRLLTTKIVSFVDACAERGIAPPFAG